MKVNIYNKEGKKTSTKVDLNNRVFKVEPNEHCIYLAIKSELAAKRQGTSSSKTRSEVSGGGRKPYKQKGTGNARVGSTRNPARVHGGSVITEKIDNNLFLSSRNIKNVNLVNVKSFSTYDIMNSNYLLIDKNSVDFLNKSLMK